MRGLRRVYFLTSNRSKFREAAEIAFASDFRLQMLSAPKIEIQSEDLREIASYAAKEAAERLRLEVVVEDAGLFINALKGFPGPYSSDVFKRLGTKGILTLMQHVSSREARFYSAAAFCVPNANPKCFAGIVRGRISTRERGKGGFGFDPIFIPAMGDGRTFAEMTNSEKNRMSHRAQSFRKLVRWLSSVRIGT